MTYASNFILISAKLRASSRGLRRIFTRVLGRVIGTRGGRRRGNVAVTFVCGLLWGHARGRIVGLRRPSLGRRPPRGRRRRPRSRRGSVVDECNEE